MGVRALLLAVPLLLAAVAPGWAYAATLRSSTSLRDDVVRLSDLFDGVENDRSIGPAPEVGGRILVEAAQLNAIAHQFGIDWHSSSSADRIILERPGRAFPREQAMVALRSALEHAGVSVDADIDVPGFIPPMVPPEIDAAADIGQLDYDPASGRFTALLALSAPGMQPVHARLSGRVQEMVDVPVAARRLLPGDVIGQADVKLGRLRADIVRSEVARDPIQALGMAVRHVVNSGSPLLLADFGRPLAVQKGEAVHIQLESAGLLISAQGFALESGATGDRIRVMNPSSRAVLDAQVLSSGQVRITGNQVSPFSVNGQSPLLVAGR